MLAVALHTLATIRKPVRERKIDRLVEVKLVIA